FRIIACAFGTLELLVAFTLDFARALELLEERFDLLLSVSRFRPALELGQYVLDEARPEVALDVVPGIELDLHDVLAPALPTSGQLPNEAPEPVHEEGLARPPIAE